jgi:hypothetical protein
MAVAAVRMRFIGNKLDPCLEYQHLQEVQTFGEKSVSMSLSCIHAQRL